MLNSKGQSFTAYSAVVYKVIMYVFDTYYARLSIYTVKR